MLFKATVGGVFVFAPQSPLKFDFGILVAVLWSMFSAGVRPLPSEFQNRAFDALNFGVVCFLTSGKIMHSDDGSTSFASNLLLWLVSAGSIVGVVAAFASEVIKGKWHDAKTLMARVTPAVTDAEDAGGHVELMQLGDGTSKAPARAKDDERADDKIAPANPDPRDAKIAALEAKLGARDGKIARLEATITQDKTQIEELDGLA